MGLDTAGDHAAAMKEDEARQRFVGGIRRHIETVGNRASRTRQPAVDSVHRRYIGAGEMHQFGECLAAGFSARAQSIARSGGGHHGEKALCQGIEGHFGSAAGRRARMWSTRYEWNALAVNPARKSLGIFEILATSSK